MSRGYWSAFTRPVAVSPDLRRAVRPVDAFEKPFGKRKSGPSSEYSSPKYCTGPETTEPRKPLEVKL